MDTVTTPIFTKLDSALGAHSPARAHFRSEGFTALQPLIGLGQILSLCVRKLEDIETFWSGIDAIPSYDKRSVLLNSTATTPVKAAVTRNIIIDVQYSLLNAQFPKIDQDEVDSAIEELCRVTLILYTMTILQERPPLAPEGIKISNVFQRKFTEAVRKLRSAGLLVIEKSGRWAPKGTRKSSVLDDFLLWTLFIAAMPMKHNTNLPVTRSWLLTAFLDQIMSNEVEIRHFQDLKDRIGRFLWVPSIHDRGLDWVWSKLDMLRICIMDDI
jgi:hypothetical protein